MVAHRNTFLGNKKLRLRVVEVEEKAARVMDLAMEKRKFREELGLEDKPWYRRIF